MTRVHRLLFVLIASLAFAGAPVCALAAQFYTEDLRIPMAEAGPQGLEAFLVRPAGTKRYPLALLSHGSPRNFEDRTTMSAHKYYGIALEYARRGFAALIVMRRGYGTSQGGRVDSVGGCANAAYLPAAAVAVADLRAAIDAMARRADVTTTGMIAAGHSAGGLATVALTAQAPPVSSPRSASPAAAARVTTTASAMRTAWCRPSPALARPRACRCCGSMRPTICSSARIWRAGSTTDFAPVAATQSSLRRRPTAMTATIFIPW
jgi:dienelactone hydrolase